MHLPGRSATTVLLAWLGVGFLGLRGTGDPWPAACAGDGFPGRTADGVLPKSTIIQKPGVIILYPTVIFLSSSIV